MPCALRPIRRQNLISKGTWTWHLSGPPSNYSVIIPHSPAIGRGCLRAGQQTEGEGECPRRPLPPRQFWVERASLNPVDNDPFDRVQGPRAACCLYWQPERLFEEMEKLVSAASVLQRG